MNISGSDKPRNIDYDRLDDQVDPRVQIELERLNTATDDINKLEVDLDEARAGFRQLLCESTVNIESLAKKLGSCIEKARPYYEARIKSKEALLETQKAALRFERANSAHAAAKEMVYLAEEGLTAEGRTFDHAWQEMLNHATMRVNESELERTLSEAHHKRTSMAYHVAETRVQQLQKELKRSIAKSRPYFEAKAQFNKLLEEQKMKVKTLEKKVVMAKNNYAEALSNLEQISDEIHKSRKANYIGMDPLGISCLSPDGTTGSSSTNQDTESTGSADSYAGEEYLRLPDRIGPNSSPVLPYRLHSGCYRKLEEISPVSPCLAGPAGVPIYRSEYLPDNVDNPHYAPEPPSNYIPGCFPSEDLAEEWSEISLAPEAPTVGQSTSGAQETADTFGNNTNDTSTTSDQSNLPPLLQQPGQPVISQWISSSAPRRQSIDTFISGGLATGERVKEILSQGIMKLNISSLSERRNSEPRRTASVIKNKKGKKVPSPLDRAQHLSNTDTDDAGGSSDTDSLASVEMLSDDQISSLMLDQEIQEACQDIISAIATKSKNDLYVSFSKLNGYYITTNK